MSLDYVSIEEAKNQLRVRHCQDDDYIAMLIRSASSAVKNYLKSTSPYDFERDSADNYLLDSNDLPIPLLDGDGNMVVLAEVKMGVLFLIGEWFRNRGTEQEGNDLGHGYLPAPVVNILYPIRDPALD